MKMKYLLNFTCTSILALTCTPALAAPLSVQQAADNIQKAQAQVVAYLPSLSSLAIAQALKNTVNKNINVIILTPRKAHMLPASYLPSLILSNAETPPRPLDYHFVTLQSPAFILIDGRLTFYGPGLQDGYGAITTGDQAFLKYATGAVNRTLSKSPSIPARTVIKERYGLKN